MVRSLPANARDVGLIPGLERFLVLWSSGERSCHNEEPISCNWIAPACHNQREPFTAVKSQHGRNKQIMLEGKKDVCRGKNLSP